MNEHKIWCEYLMKLSLDELDMQKTQLELEIQGNREIAESKRLGYLPQHIPVEDYEHEAEEAQLQLEFVKRFIHLHRWANSKIGTTLGRGSRKRVIVSYYPGTKGTGVYFNSANCAYPTYQLVPE